MRRQALLDLAGSVAVSGGSGLVQGAALGSVAQLARRLFQMGNSGAEIEQEQPVQYIDPEQGSLDDNVRDLYAYYRKQAQIDSAAKDGIMETETEYNTLTSQGGKKYYRVQGGEIDGKMSQYRILINSDQTISIPNKTAALNISAYDLKHARYFRDTARPGAEIIEFEVPGYFDALIRENLVDQYGYRLNPLNQGGTAPKLVDPTTPGISYELPGSPWISWLEEYAHSARRIE